MKKPSRLIIPVMEMWFGESPAFQAGSFQLAVAAVTAASSFGISNIEQVSVDSEEFRISKEGRERHRHSEAPCKR